jgi:hypothetical protein
MIDPCTYTVKPNSTSSIFTTKTRGPSQGVLNFGTITSFPNATNTTLTSLRQEQKKELEEKLGLGITLPLLALGGVAALIFFILRRRRNRRLLEKEQLSTEDMYAHIYPELPHGIHQNRSEMTAETAITPEVASSNKFPDGGVELPLGVDEPRAELGRFHLTENS